MSRLKPSIRNSWAPNSEDRCHIVPPLKYYRCVSIYSPSTKTVRPTDIVYFPPTIIPIPKVSLEDHVKATTTHLINLLTKKKHSIGPFLQETTRDHLLRITVHLHRDKSTPYTYSLPFHTNTISEGAIVSKNI